MEQQQAMQPQESSRSPNYTAEELYLVVRAQQGQIRELVNFTSELNDRIKKWELFFGDKFSGVFAGETGTVEDADLMPVQLEQEAAKGFAALLAGEPVAGNSPAVLDAPMPVQDTEPKLSPEQERELANADL